MDRHTNDVAREVDGRKAQRREFPASTFLQFLIVSVSDCWTIMELWIHKPITLSRPRSSAELNWMIGMCEIGVLRDS